MRPAKYNHNYPSTTEILPNTFDPTWWYKSKRRELLTLGNDLNKVDPIEVCLAHKYEQQRIGKGVHKAMEDYFETGELKCSYEFFPMALKIVDWCEKMGLKPFKIEEPLYWNCEEHHVKPHTKDCVQDCLPGCTSFALGGTPDVLATFSSTAGLWVIDWKTDRVPPSTSDERETAIKYYWQNSSYAMMAEKTYGVTIAGGITVRSTTLEKVKPKTQIKSKLVLPEYVKVEYSKDLTFATYTYTNLTKGFEAVKMLNYIDRQVKGK